MRNAYEIALEFVTEQASADADLKEKARALADLICTERDVLKNRISDMINDFSWVIPFYDDARINEASDMEAGASPMGVDLDGMGHQRRLLEIHPLNGG